VSSINKVTNANIYLDGENYLGRAEEVTLPEISPKMVDHKALGMVGELELPAGLQKMSAKIKWNAIYPEAMKKTHDVFTAIRLMVRSSVDTFEGGTRIGQAPFVAYMTVVPKKAGGLVFKPQDNVEREDEFNVTAYRMEVDGEEVVNIDIMANIWSVNGVDQLAVYRENLGV
jgi:uncharacterized protein